MKKNVKIIIFAIIVIVAIIGLVIFLAPKSKNNLGDINTVEDLTSLVEKVYENVTIEMPMVQTQAIDVADEALVQMMTGLENANDLEFVVASEPMMSSQAYSFVLVKVKDGVNTNEIAKKMKENIDTRKWICVTAEKVYTTSTGNVVCLVMSNEEVAKEVYTNFKELAGNVKEEFERTEQTGELPEDLQEDEVM